MNCQYNYQDSIDYIYSFINVQNNSGITLEEKLSQNVKRMQVILGELDYKQTFKVAHIAGTKGKGSTTFTLSNMLMSSGYNVGRILSPHIIDFRERISINNKWIEKSDVIDITIKIKTIIEKLNIKPSAFEIMTAISLYYFYINDVDYACVEVGLGGKYDSTNIVEPSVSIITSISFDHVERLGNSLASIASEKAGIIKNTAPCVSAYQDESVISVITEACKDNGSAAYFYKKDFSAEIVENNIDRLDFIYSETDTNYNLNIQTSLVGSYQAENISLALFAYRLLLGKNADIDTSKILDTLANIKFDGRFSIISKNPHIVADGAHNAYSIECLLSNTTKYFDKKIVLFFAPLKDKDIGGMCGSIKHYESYIEKIIITSSTFFEGFKESDSIELYEKMSVYNFDITIEQFDNFDNAINHATEYAKQTGLPILITGSLYTVSSAINKIEQQQSSNPQINNSN